MWRQSSCCICFSHDHASCDCCLWGNYLMCSSSLSTFNWLKHHAHVITNLIIYVSVLTCWKLYTHITNVHAPMLPRRYTCVFNCLTRNLSVVPSYYPSLSGHLYCRMHYIGMALISVLFSPHAFDSSKVKDFVGFLYLQTKPISERRWSVWIDKSINVAGIWLTR